MTKCNQVLYKFHSVKLQSSWTRTSTRMSDFIVTVDQIQEIRRIISDRHGIPLSKWSDLVPELVPAADDRNAIFKWIRDDKVSFAVGTSLEIWTQTEGRNATFSALLSLFRNRAFNALADELERWAWDSIQRGSSNWDTQRRPFHNTGKVLRRSRSSAAMPYSNTLPRYHLGASREGLHAPLQRSESDRLPSSQSIRWDRDYGELRRSESQSVPADVQMQHSTVQNRRYFGAIDERHVHERQSPQPSLGQSRAYMNCSSCGQTARHVPLQPGETVQPNASARYGGVGYSASQLAGACGGANMSMRSPSYPSSARSSTASLNQFTPRSPSRRGCFGGSSSSFSEAETSQYILAPSDVDMAVDPPAEPENPNPTGASRPGDRTTKSHRKSNRQQIQSALGHCIFPGQLNHTIKSNILEAIKKSNAEYFLVLFRDHRLQYRGIYSVQEVRGREHIVRFCGTGPRQITPSMLDSFYKYDCVSKCFLSSRDMLDGFTIHNKYWAKRSSIAKP